MAEVLLQLNIRPRLLNVFAMVKLYLEGHQNGSVVNLFRYAEHLKYTKDVATATTWAALKQNELGKPEIFMQATTTDPEFIRKSTLALIELVYPLVETYPTIELVTATEIADVVHEFFREKGYHPFCPFDEPNYYYYASDSDIPWLKQSDIALPDGFEYVNLSPDQADEMVSVMLHADEDGQRETSHPRGQAGLVQQQAQNSLAAHSQL
ncbi:hypothetical protein AAVH_29397 [Aphelenchoides avenae]|nr:hypothetical protein AAVH_29397 [Aphelenchus avenae]